MISLGYCYIKIFHLVTYLNLFFLELDVLLKLHTVPLNVSNLIHGICLEKSIRKAQFHVIFAHT